jgi:ABC-2 type transport system ATP-binding protein
MTETIVRVDQVKKSYDGKTVVKGISFEVKKGEVFGILGPNGAGKTTTLEMIEALRPIDEGTVTLDGLNVAEEPDKVKHLIGVQLQSSAFFDKLNLIDLLNMFAGFYGRRVNAMQLLEEVQLTDKAKSEVKNLSGGQKQRFSIAVALVNNPKVLFLDEPTTGLDPQARRNLWDLVQDIQKKGITIIMTTHYMEEASLLCDRVAIMDDGAIIALDSPQALVKQLLAKGFHKKVQVDIPKNHRKFVCFFNEAFLKR